jgi:hypothetical protein
MNDESALRKRAREAMKLRRLPQRRPDKMWGGPGTGATCSVCGEPIRGDEMGFDLEFADVDGRGSVGSHHTHIRCFAAWEFERDKSEIDGVGHRAEPGSADKRVWSETGCTCVLVTSTQDRLT